MTREEAMERVRKVWVSHGPDTARVAELILSVERETLESAAVKCDEWAGYYPEDQFGGAWTYQEALRADELLRPVGLTVGRISGGMGRHCGTVLAKQFREMAKDCGEVEAK